MENLPEPKKELTSLTTPGVGIAGKTLCPYTRGICQKEACEKWVELQYGTKMVGRCSESWVPIILTEVRKEIENIKKVIEK